MSNAHFLSKVLAIALLLILSNAASKGSPHLWAEIQSSVPANSTFQFNTAVFRELVREAQAKDSISPGQFEITVPMPDASPRRFLVSEASVMSPELAAKFPEINTFSGYGVNDPSESIRISFDYGRFRAQILSPNGTVYIEPVTIGEEVVYTSNYKNRLTIADENFACFTEPTGESSLLREKPSQTSSTSQIVQRVSASSGNLIRTYRLAVAAQGEYTAYHGGTVAGAMSSIVAAINRINGIYETELGIRFTLVPDNDKIIFTSASSDPYPVNGPTTSTLAENQKTIDQIIGNANYDLGIVFNTGNAGIAQIRGVCSPQFKAYACIGSPNPNGDAFWVGYVAHEIAHMFGAEHTFNGSGGFCNGRGSIHSAYEPGAGSTIMGYSGLCGSDSFQSQADPYFHAISIQQIGEFISGNTCATLTPSGNRPARVQTQSGATIPKGTPFQLTAAGSDADGDPITFCWEQFDLGPVQPLSSPDNGSSPLFRSFPPTANPTRTFPRMEDILRNRLSPGEKLPMTSRKMLFRVTARDGRPGGGLEWEQTEISVHGNAGPFFITAPGPNTTWFGLRPHPVTWDVAKTSLPPINTSAVRILLSTNGGSDFNIVLAANTPNDGSETVVFPNVPRSNMRIKVEAIGNIFFDISDAFSIAQTFPPAITVHPEGKNTVLTNTSFSVSATGTPPFEYQWQFNGQDIPGATSQIYSFDVTSVAQSGMYRCRVSNPAGSMLSDEAQLNVVVELVKPTVNIQAPLPTRVTNGTVNVSGAASDNAGLREVRWRINDQPFQLASGATSWSAVATLFPGKNRFEVISIDTSANESAPATHDFFYVVTSPLTVSSTGGGTITPDMNGQSLEIGAAYKMVAKPNRGQVFAGWSGGLHASEPELHFVMQSNLVIEAKFIPNPFGELRGAYSGLFFETNEVRHETSGYFTVRTSNNGKYSGRVFIGGKSFPISGAFNGIGESTRPIRTGRITNLFANLKLDMTNGSGGITGSIGNDSWTAELTGHRSTFHARNNPSPQAGKYTGAMRHSPGSSGYPAGTSFATLSVNGTGSVRASGMFSDGTRFTQSTVLSQEGEWPFYASLYRGGGSTLGWIILSENTKELSGDASWIKTGGFTNELRVAGANYSPPRRAPALSLTNAILTLADGNLSSAIVTPMTLNRNRFIAQNSAEKIMININPSSGLLTGSFIHPDTRKRATIKGVALQSENLAEGFFIGSDASGTVLLNGN